MGVVEGIGASGVRIDATTGQGPGGVTDGAKAPPRARTDGPQPAEGVEVDSANLRLAEAAAACAEVDVQAVAEARKLLAAGRLDTPAAALRAAQAMLDRGL